MNLSPVEQYLQRKAALLKPSEPLRYPCLRCRKPPITCYCSQVATIASDPQIVILMHPLEARHAVGTGRMAHQCLSNSRLILGTEFTRHQAVNELIHDPALYPLLLFPGPTSLNISNFAPHERRAQLPQGRTPVVIVLDGTWHCARKMLYRSPNLQKLPRICFNPTRPSEFIVRKQPHPQCVSTIEAIHEFLTLMSPSAHDSTPQTHDVLLEVFRKMVAKQLGFRREGPTRHTRNYLARKARKSVEACAGSA